MKQNIRLILGAVTVGFVFTAYLWAYATTPKDPVDWRDADLIVQDMLVEEALPLFAAEGLGNSHIALVDVRDEGTVVIEVKDAVVETPVHEFLKRGRTRAFSVYRLASLTQVQKTQIVSNALDLKGKPADFFLSPDPVKIYSAELVRLSYAAAGLPLGEWQKLGRVSSNTKPVYAKFQSQWKSFPACKRRYLNMAQCWDVVARQEVVTPSSIIRHPGMVRIGGSESPSLPPSDVATADQPASSSKP